MDLFFAIKGNELQTCTTLVKLKEVILIRRHQSIPGDSQVTAL